MQGFFNFMIFIRPRVIKIRNHNPQVWYIHALLKATITKNQLIHLRKGSIISKRSVTESDQGRIIPGLGNDLAAAGNNPDIVLSNEDDYDHGINYEHSIISVT